VVLNVDTAQDKYRAEMSNYDDTPLSNEGHEHKNWGGVAPGDLHNRRQPTSSPVALCGKCADRSSMLQASMVVGMQMVLGVCIPISSHPLFVQMHSKCGDGSGSNPDDMTQCTTASMPMRCEEFVSGFGAVERQNVKLNKMNIYHTHAHTDGVWASDHLCLLQLRASDVLCCVPRRGAVLV